jgi:hypothetical protein
MWQNGQCMGVPPRLFTSKEALKALKPLLKAKLAQIVPHYFADACLLSEEKHRN